MTKPLETPFARRRDLLRSLWFLAIFVVVVASLLPADSLAVRTLDRLPITDKTEHTAMYALLAFLPALYERRGMVVATAVGLVALGVGLEFAQLASGWRKFETADMLADALGVGIGLAAGVAVRFRVPVRIRPLP
jgi:VanZ family protein